MKFENTRVYNFDGAFRGMRNPKNSWHLSDSGGGLGNWDDAAAMVGDVAYLWAFKEAGDFDLITDEMVDRYEEWLYENATLWNDEDYKEFFCIGPKDMRLAKALISGGSEHRKFLRQIQISVDITAPLYW